MIWIRLVAMGMAIAGVAGMGQDKDARGVGISSTVTLAGLRDLARPLLIFAPNAADGRLEEQLKILMPHAKEAAEMGLVAVAVPEAGSFPVGHRLSEADGVEARKRFHVAAGEFVVVLVGKDGGEKLRSGKPFAFEMLRDTINAMPMRREEMKGRGK